MFQGTTTRSHVLRSRAMVLWRSSIVLASVLVISHGALTAREKRASPVPDDQVVAFESGDKVAVVVGVGDYPSRSGLRPLPYAARDAEEVAAELRRLGYLVTVLQNSNATRPIVLKALEDTRKVLSGPDALVLFVFSGHGFSLHGENFLATHEAFLEDLEATGLPLNAVLSGLSATGAHRQVLLLDACRNDPGAKAKSLNLRSFDSLSVSSGLRALFSTKAGEVSFESEELQQGVFTHFLLRGLRGEAAGADGLVTFRDLSDYVTSSVRVWGFERGQVQVPYESTLDGEASGDFLLADSASRRAPDTYGARHGRSGVSERRPRYLDDPGVTNPSTREAIDVGTYTWSGSPVEIDPRLLVFDGNTERSFGKACIGQRDVALDWNAGDFEDCWYRCSYTENFYVRRCDGTGRGLDIGGVVAIVSQQSKFIEHDGQVYRITPLRVSKGQGRDCMFQGDNCTSRKKKNLLRSLPRDGGPDRDAWGIQSVTFRIERLR